MRRSRGTLALVAGLAVAGCAAGPAPAEAQTPPAPGVDGRAAEDLARAHMYEVTPDMLPTPGTPVRAQEATDPVPFVQVSGQGTVEVSPDRARVRFAVETEGSTAQEASRRNAERMDAVIRAIRGTNLPGLEIETSGYDLQPQYSRPERQVAATISGYRATNHVLVTVDDVTAAGRLIDAAITAGANRVASLTFEARNTEAAQQEAIQKAVRSARQQAEAMAAALGVPLGPPLEVHGGANVPGPRPQPFYRMEAAQAMDVATPVEPGEQMITASVSIKFRLRR